MSYKLIHIYVHTHLLTYLTWVFTTYFKIVILNWSINCFEKIFLPTSIAQSAATSSCFARFKHFTTYMGHLDVDEFFFAPRQPHTYNNNNNNTEKDDVNSDSAVNSLISFVRRRFSRRPLAPALAFTPVTMLACKVKPQLEYNIFRRKGVNLPPSAFWSTRDSNRNETLKFLPRLGYAIIHT